MIILEGMDNSGKSTLAKRFGLEITHPGPAPRTKFEELRCLDTQLLNARMPIVQDRVTCISSQVYGASPNYELLNGFLRDMLRTPHCIVIYCRPPSEMIVNFRMHKAKAHDTEEHLQFIQNNAIKLIGKYDDLMVKIPHIKYDWTHPESIDFNAIEFTQFSHTEWKRWIQRLTP